MKLLLVRHGEAWADEADPGLTERGWEVVRQVAAWCRDNHVMVVQIRHSGKKRASQTAAIFSEHLKPRQGVAAVAGCKPNDDVAALADLLQDELDDVMYVSHLPFLFNLVELLLQGRFGSNDMRPFGNANIVCLSRTDKAWAIDWTMPPELEQCWPQLP
jgi:phosphohistidine phosphatase